jgi:hypothetical protein
MPNHRLFQKRTHQKIFRNGNLLPVNWTSSQSEKTSFTTSFNNTVGKDDNITIYTYLKEIERNVNGKKTLETFTYKIYDFGGARISELSGVNITTPREEVLASIYECVPSNAVVVPTINKEVKQETTSITIEKKVDQPKVIEAVNKEGNQTQPAANTQVDT